MALRRKPVARGRKFSALLAVLLATVVQSTPATAQGSSGCETASLGFAALVVQRESDRAALNRCRQARLSACRAEVEQLEQTEHQLEMIRTFLRGCAR